MEHAVTILLQGSSDTTGGLPEEAAVASLISVAPETPAISHPFTPTPRKEFTALRKVVEFKEMEVGELVARCGLSAGLRAMCDAEINPIVNDGECSPTMLHLSS